MYSHPPKIIPAREPQQGAVRILKGRLKGPQIISGSKLAGQEGPSSENMEEEVPG